MQQDAAGCNEGRLLEGMQDGGSNWGGGIWGGVLSIIAPISPSADYHAPCHNIGMAAAIVKARASFVPVSLSSCPYMSCHVVVRCRLPWCVGWWRVVCLSSFCKL
jgi:hypothetical protein